MKEFSPGLHASAREALARLDIVLGLRASGLILYGALPANLMLLGISKVDISLATLGIQFFFLLAVAIPVILIFMLIRAQHKRWYLITNYLFARCTITTLVILLISSGICNIANIIQRKYETRASLPAINSGIPQSLKEVIYFDEIRKELCVKGILSHDEREFLMLHPCADSSKWCAAVKALHDSSQAEILFQKGIPSSFAFGAISLVLSSAFFMAALGKGTNLPGLPSQDFVSKIEEARGFLVKLKSSKIWDEPMSTYDGLLKDLQGAQQAVHEASLKGGAMARLSLEALEASINTLSSVVTETKNNVPNDFIWNVYFGKSLDAAEKKQRSAKRLRYDSVSLFRTLKLG